MADKDAKDSSPTNDFRWSHLVVLLAFVWVFNNASCEAAGCESRSDKEERWDTAAVRANNAADKVRFLEERIEALETKVEEQRSEIERARELAEDAMFEAELRSRRRR